MSRLVPYQSEAMFRATTDQYVDSTTPFYVGPGTFRSSDGHIYIRLAKTAEMRYVESRDGQVFNTDLPDPRNYSIVISGVGTTISVTGVLSDVRRPGGASGDALDPEVQSERP